MCFVSGYRTISFLVLRLSPNHAILDRVNKSPPVSPAPSHLNSVYKHPISLMIILILFPSAPRSFKLYFLFTLPNQNSV